MGVKSKLRKEGPAETRYSDVNGNRKLYDRDKPPDGVDFDVWHLAIYFEQEAETDRMPVAGRPILYTELNYRINESGVRVKYPDTWIDILEQMIILFWWDTHGNYTINHFCSADRFDYCLQWVLDKMGLEELVRTGVRVKQQEREIQAARRTPEETEAMRIITAKYTEQDLKFKLEEFKSRSNT